MSDLIFEWEQADRALRKAKKLESDLRKALVAHHHPVTLPEGTTTIEDLFSGNEHDVVLKITQPFSYKLDASFPQEWSNSVVIRTKYELVKAEYNKLSDVQKNELQRWLTISPGSPSVKVIHTEADA